MTSHAVLLAIPHDDALSRPERVVQQRVYARRALQRCAALCGAPPDGWSQSEDGVPLPNAGFYWSISHKRDMAAAVIADHRVGIDVECVLPRRADLFEAVATAGEWSLMPDRSWHSFFRVFTAKEATLKANGMGIGYLAECRVAAVLDVRRMVMRWRSCEVAIDHHDLGHHLSASTFVAEPPVWHVGLETNGTSAPV